MTLSVMDELDFTSSYECVKCKKFEGDLKVAKSEVCLHYLDIQPKFGGDVNLLSRGCDVITLFHLLDNSK